MDEEQTPRSHRPDRIPLALGHVGNEDDDMSFARLFGRRATQKTTEVSAKQAEERREIADKLVQEDERRAKRVQQQLLTQIPAIAGWSHALVYRPTSAVGGDLVDVNIMGDNRILIAIGDVSGHGTQGALIAVSARKALHALIDRVESLADLIINLNEDLRRDLTAGQFITAFVGILNPDDGRLVYACCGHHHALVVDAQGPIHLRRLASSGMALGVADSETMAERLTLRETTIPQQASLVIYTDGLPETRNSADQEFEEEGVMASLIGASRSEPQQLADILLSAAQAHHGSEQLEDDATILVIKRP
ncbi:MAG: serine/threonine-protein phosphatase [Planctomycetota bacterium]|nr:MAG: serine/threonine-protein phosphatase [Planctomycetota bacterium]